MRESTDLSNYNYDSHLSQKAKTSPGAMRELKERTKERRQAHDSSGIGYHFGIDNKPVKVTSKEHFKHELNKRGLMLHTDVKKDLR